MTRHRGHLARALIGLIATGALIVVATTGTVAAAGPSVAEPDARLRQYGGGVTGTSPDADYPPSPPMDAGITEVGFVGLPITIEVGQTLDVRVQAPGGATCAGRIAYPSGQWQSLDEAGSRVGPCAWDVTVPIGVRPGSLVLSVDVGRGGDSRNILGVVYVSTRALG